MGDAEILLLNMPVDRIEISTSRPPYRANRGHLTIFCTRGMGNFTDKAVPGVGNRTLPRRGGENLTWSVRFQRLFFVLFCFCCFFFFRAPKSLTAINTCLDEMETDKDTKRRNDLQPPKTTYNHLQPPRKIQQPPETTSKTSTTTHKQSNIILNKP